MHAVDNRSTASMLNFRDHPRVRTRSIAVDRRRWRAMAVDGRNVHVTARYGTLRP